MTPLRYFTTPDLPGVIRTYEQIAALAGCQTQHARDAICKGKSIAGHVWTRADGGPAPVRTRGKVRKLMVSDDFPGQTFSQAEVRAMGRLSDKTPLQPYVRKQMKIGGHVWRFLDCAEDLARLDKPTAPAKPCGNWRKDGEPAPAPRPTPEPARRAWVYATDPAAYDVLPVNGQRIPAADGPAEGGSR